MIKILQINLGRAKAAHDLALMKATEINADIIIVPEPNVNISKNQGWFRDKNSDVAVLFRNKNCGVTSAKAEEGYVVIDMQGIRIICCYISPNIHVTEYKRRVERITNPIRGIKEAIIAGDINAKNMDWGSPRNDARGIYGQR